jgi:hypothetical protein
VISYEERSIILGACAILAIIGSLVVAQWRWARLYDKREKQK